MMNLRLSLKEKRRCLGWIQEQGGVSAPFVSLTSVDMTGGFLGNGGYQNPNSIRIPINPPGRALLLAALKEF